MTVASETWSQDDASAISFWTPSSSSATRSSRATGAERWEMPTTRTLMPHLRERRRRDLVARVLVRLPLLVVGEDLQLDRQVDLADVDALGHRDHGRGEVEDAGDAGGDHPVGDVLGRGRGRGDHADRDGVLAGDRLEVVERAHRDTGDDLLVPLGVGVEQRHDPEAAAAEPRVVGERVAEVSDPDDDHGPVLGHADLASDLVAQVVDVVADTAGAVAAEVGQVLAELGAVDARGDREVLARAGADAGVGERRQGPQVDGQARDGGLRDDPGRLARTPCGHSSSFQPRSPGPRPDQFRSL